MRIWGELMKIVDSMEGSREGKNGLLIYTIYF